MDLTRRSEGSDEEDAEDAEDEADAADAARGAGEEDAEMVRGRSGVRRSNASGEDEDEGAEDDDRGDMLAALAKRISLTRPAEEVGDEEETEAAASGRAFFFLTNAGEAAAFVELAANLLFIALGIGGRFARPLLLPLMPPPPLLGTCDTGMAAALETDERADDLDKTEVRALMLVAATRELPGGRPWRTDICLTSCTSGVPCRAEKNGSKPSLLKYRTNAKKKSKCKIKTNLCPGRQSGNSC